MATRYTKAIAERLCARLADGESLRSATKAEGVGASTVLEWTEAYPDFGEQYARARDIGYKLLADELIDISDTPKRGTKTKTDDKGTEVTEGDMIEHRRLQVDTRKWILSKMLPKLYGDRQHIEHSGNIGIGERMKRAEERLKGEK